MVICPNINQLTSIVGKPWIDLFAPKQNYVSHVPDGRTYSVDALTTHWGGRWAYAYPPHALLPNILSKIQSEDYMVLLIAPAFLQARWFQTLLSLSIEIPVRLLANRSMHKQPLSHVFHRQSEALCVYVLTLSQNQNISKNIYLTALFKNFRQRQN